MKVIDFADMFGDRMTPRETPPDILPEAAVERLREAMPRYVGQCPFKPGDLVTPRKDSTIVPAQVGKPYLVIEVPPAAKMAAFDGGTVGTAAAGWRQDMRTIHIEQDRITPMWQDSAEYEPYIGPGCSQ